ncbi:heat stress transcription factor A-8 [Cornus florida]|uniref:heat stress transcription factor A-8 n=1 Tax=Cornus florida TaxID=4283 RepID=UPI0028964E55|nr:heat stress transcription factor A-8 [Cornus florida]
MVKTTENGSGVPAFLSKCYEMVDDQSTDGLISWSSSDDSFVIWNAPEFSSALLPNYFKHNNFASFIRQLNIYGFRKIDTDRWEFANEGFMKGQKQLLKNISRRKSSQGLDQRRSSQKKDKDVEAREENKNFGLWKEVENLQIDKNALMEELAKLRQKQQSSQSKLLVLRDQLQGMEQNQQQMLSFIVMAMQNPGFLVKLLQPRENNWRVAEPGKSVLKRVSDDHEPSEGMIVRYQGPIDDSPDDLYRPISTSEESLQLGLNPDDDFFMNIDFPLEEEFQSPDKHGMVILPDLTDDDGTMDRLLSSPFLQKIDGSELDIEDTIDSGMEMESTSCRSQLKESAKFENLAEGLEISRPLKMETSACKMQLDGSQNMVILTEQMGLLASQRRLKR